MARLTQDPEPGKHCLLYRGDTIEFKLESDAPINGRAYLRTNVGNASVKREEIVSQVESKGAMAGQDWHNIPMTRVDQFSFSLKLALVEVGHFEAKCCVFLADKDEPAWPDGDNIHINVEPAAYCCANSVYCAFVRQFGLNKDRKSSALPEGVSSASLKALDDRNFAVIPPSGTFRDLAKELDHIFGSLNCRILHLLPVNPTPTVYGRMGRYGSPYAALDFTAVDPSLAEFDRAATPLDQFLELVDAVHRKNGKLFIDIAINHTGWASKLHETHPEWFVREPDGAIHSPGAWGVVWGDLTELDHRRVELWSYLAEVFLTWCSRGVDGFRCDAGYMIPVPAWEYIIARVRSEYPDTVFLLEGLGGDPAVTNRLLNIANMNWAYSELFQNYTREQIDGYLSYAWKVSSGDGLMIHYAETHDNSRLAANSQKYARMRTALSALASSNGAFGFTNGVEWFAEEKIDVHEASALNWGASVNQIDFIARLNRILFLHPAFHNGAVLNVVGSGSPQVAMFARSDESFKRNLLIAVNLDCAKGADVKFDPSDVPFDTPELFDLISGRRINVITLPGSKRGFSLPGGQAMCLTPDAAELKTLLDPEAGRESMLRHLDLQEAKAMALDILCKRNAANVLSDEDPDALARLLLDDPMKFLESVYGPDVETPVVRWHWPADLKREVMLPPGHCLLVTSKSRFRAGVLIDGKALSGHLGSIRGSSGEFFALLPPSQTPDAHKPAKLAISVYGDKRLERGEAPLLLLGACVDKAAVSFDSRSLRVSPKTFVQGNGRGAIVRTCLDWNAIRSRYDAILLGNLSVEHPEDRHIMWRRLRIWSLYHARTQEFNIDTLRSFHVAKDGGGVWDFRLPVGNGLYIDVAVKLEILPGRNAVAVTVQRSGGHDGRRRLCDETPVRLIVRPDIEDRNFHFETKASQGPEKLWPKALKALENGFEFKPADDRAFILSSSKGRYKQAPEWYYNIWQSNEAARGLQADSDLFSPGYFDVSIAGSESFTMIGQIATPAEKEKLHPPQLKKGQDPFEQADPSFEATLLHAMRQFVVKRGKLKTVIAGYPWFLDWGRDTLICARGLIAAPEFREDVKDILLQFAIFAENGTLPNMISGGNASNRDTSDAPLWLFIACKDLCEAEGSNEFLKTSVKRGVSLLKALESLAQGMVDGAANGVKMDKASGLLFSPSHFTWMDTNFPAGTPREGYPVEIQALWHAALKFLGSATDSEDWTKLAGKVKTSIRKYFPLEGKGYLSDCLHCEAGTPASKAVPDDHLRPNQLFAITLGAISDKPLCESMLKACSSLLVPGAIRTLADKRVEFLLPVGPKDKPVNDPAHPYYGRYEGDEDTKRKPAYHNGTAWTWPFPSYCEAYSILYGKSGLDTAKSILSSSKLVLDDGCVGQIPEILDGDWPHAQRGCDAQAWGASELYRVWKLLHKA